MGLSPRELKATYEKIPIKILLAIPQEAKDALLCGAIPAKGFGIGGDTGGGKTMALAALMRQHLTAIYPRMDMLKGIKPGKRIWSCWPDEVNNIRRHATDDATPLRLEALETCSLLILDDLGRERIKGTYADDWAASQLDGIISRRYNKELPTLWTTNVTEPNLLALYGAAMYSRLVCDNPLVWVNGLEILR